MLLAVLCACIAVSGVIYSLLNKPVSETQRRLDAVMAMGPQRPRTGRTEQPARPSRLDALRSRMRQVLPSGLRDKLAVMLVAAGMRSQPENVALLWATLAVGLPALYFFMVARGGSVSRVQLLIGGALTFLGFYLPLTLIRGRIRKRRHGLSRALPDAMDLLTTCVEAGLGIDAALAKVADKAKEPLGEEIRLVLRVMAMGRTRRESLEMFADRNALPEIRSLVSAIIQAEQMGVSLGHVLRVQTEALRVQRRQKAEQTAQKAPVKIIIVLALFIFPAMFIVILGPAVMQFMSNAII